MSKDSKNETGLNLEDFRLENVFDSDYVSEIDTKKPEITLETKDTSIPEEEENPENDEEDEYEEQEKVEIPIEKTVPASPKTKVSKAEVDEVVEETTDEGIDLKPFYNLFHEKLGWEIDEENAPENSIDGLINYMNNIVENASKPQYANEISEQFDRYLASGGDPRKFAETMFSPKDYSDFEMKSEDDRKQVLKEYLIQTNPNRDMEWVDRKINRYEDSGVLDEESDDALEILKTADKANKANLVVNQEKERQKQMEEYQSQLSNLHTRLKNKTEIAKIPVNKAEMDDFFNFMTKAEKDGTTRYEKKIKANEEAALVAAYLAYKDFDINNLKTNVRSDVVKDLKKSLSKFSSSNTGLNSKTGLPIQSNRQDYKPFDLNL